MPSTNARTFHAQFLFGVLAILASTNGCRAQIVWNGGGTNDNWMTPQNWIGGIAPISSTSTFVRFQGTVRPTPFTDANSPWILNRLDFESQVFAGNNSFTLSGNQLSFQGSGPQIHSYAQAVQTINNDIAIPTSDLNIIAGAGITFAGLIGGSNGLVVTSSITLSNSNSYTGTTTIGANSSTGSVTISNPNALGSTENGTVVKLGSQLRLSGGITVTGESLSLSTGSGYNAGGLKNISGNNAWAGDITLGFDGGLYCSNAGETLTVGGNIAGANYSLQAGGPGDILLLGALTNLHLSKYGTGTLTLSGASSPGYQILVNDGTLLLASDTAVPASTAIQLNPNTGNIYDPAYPTLKIEQDTTIGGLYGYSSGGIATVDIGPNTLTLNQGYFSTFSGAITGTGTFIKAGAGLIEMGGPSTYSGGTYINGGGIDLDSESILGTPPVTPSINIVMNSGELQAGACVAITLDARRIIQLNGACTLTSSNCVNNPKPFIVPGQITGPGSLIKNGNGIVELSNPSNSYGGATVVNAGILQFDSPTAIGGNGGDMMIVSAAAAASGYPIDQQFLNHVAPASNGVIAIAVDSTNDLDFGAPGLSNVLFAAIGAKTYGGTIAPGPTGYRLGGWDGTLTLTKEDALSGSASLHVGIDSSTTGKITLLNGNTLDGDVIVHGGTLELVGVSLDCDQLEVKAQATQQLTGGTVNANVVVDAKGSLHGCGVINGDLTNNGTITIDCNTGLQVAGDIINNGTMTFLGGATLSANGSFTNNGLLDLLTSTGTVLPAQFINTGMVVYAGNVRILGMSRLPTSFSVIVQSFTGHNYQLQRSSTLADNDWTNISAAKTGSTGSPITLVDSSAPSPHQFYRIEVSP